MPGNSLLTPTIITKEALRVLHNNLAFARKVNKQYDKNFAQTGAKIGNSLTVRLPNRYTIRTGAVMGTQNQNEQSVIVTLATQKGVDMNFTSAELTMTIDDFSKRYIQPAMAKLASQIDYDGLSLYKDIYSTVGTPGTAPNSALIYLQAAQKLNELAAPQGMRAAIINPAAQAATVNALTNLLNPSKAISEQYLEGEMGTALGFEFGMDQNINVHTCGSRVASATVTVKTNSAEGDTTIALTGATTTTFKAGDVFTVSSVNAVNPETGQSTGALAQFVVTADATAVAGDVTVSVSPVIRSTGALATVTALPLAGANVTFVGTASTAYPQNMAFHRDAFTLATADLELPKGVDFASRQVYDGISMRIVRAYDINNDQMPCRIDVYYGWKTLRPELACRIFG